MLYIYLYNVKNKEKINEKKIGQLMKMRKAVDLKNLSRLINIITKQVS